MGRSNCRRRGDVIVVDQLVYRRSWPSRDETKASINEWIEKFYNRERRHSYLGLRSPEDYERIYAQKKPLAA
jgi:putative transposase